MFLRQRFTQTEYFDLPDRAEDRRIAAEFVELNRVNTLLSFSHPSNQCAPSWLGRDGIANTFKTLIVGAGMECLGAKPLDRLGAERSRVGNGISPTSTPTRSRSKSAVRRTAGGVGD